MRQIVVLGAIAIFGLSASAQTPAQFDSALKAAYAKYRSNDSGAVADYIPELGKQNPKLFGIALVTPDGKAYTIGDADSLFVLDIYAASEQPISGVTAERLAQHIRDRGGKAAEYKSSFDEAASAATARAESGDMILTLGAGNVSQLGPMLVERLAAREHAATK